MTMNVTWRVSKTPLVISESPGQDTIDVSNFGMASGIQNIGFAASEAIATTEVGTLGWAFFQNCDSTNFVKIGPYDGATFHPFVKLKPGEYCILRLMTGITIHAQADTAAIELYFRIIDN